MTSVLKKNIAANYVGQGLSGAANLIFIPIYIALFGLASFGLIGLYNIALAWLPIFDLGLNQTVARTISAISVEHSENLSRKASKARKNYAKVSFIIALSIGILTFATSKYIAYQWIPRSSVEPGTIATCLKIMSGIFALRILENPYRATLLGLQEHISLNQINTVFIISRGLGILLLAPKFGATLIFFFAWNLLISLLSLGALCIQANKRFRNKRRFKAPSESILEDESSKKNTEGLEEQGFARGVIIITFLSLFLIQFDRLILSRIITLDQFAQYTVATTAAGIIFTVTNPISTSILPQLSESYLNSKPDDFRNKFEIASQFSSILAGTCGLTLLLFSFQVIFAWTGDENIASQCFNVLILLAIGNLFNAYTSVPVQAQLSKGITKPTICLLGLSTLFYIPLLIILAPKYGVYACAGLWLLQNVCIMYPGLALTFKESKLGEFKDWIASQNFKGLPSMLLIALMIRASYGFYVSIFSSSRITAAAFVIVNFLAVSFTGLIATNLLAPNLPKRF